MNNLMTSEHSFQIRQANKISQPSIVVQNLVKKYPTGFVAVNNLSLSVNPGEIFGFLGANGAGKTTTLRILATLLEPSEGTATVAGFDIRKNTEEVRRNIGVVNGGMGLYDRLTGREILEYFASFYDLSKQLTNQRIENLNASLGLSEVLERRTAEFSTGMKQKIVIARAVIHEPTILILDEATNGLDVLARRAVLDFARTYRDEGKTVIYSTHVMSEVEELCERAAIIDHGKLIAEGPVSHLIEQTQSLNLEEAFFKFSRVSTNNFLQGVL